MHRRFAVVLRSVLLVVMLMGMLGRPLPVQAAEVGSVRGGVSATVNDSFPAAFERSPLSHAPEAGSVPEAAAPLIGDPVALAREDSSLDTTSANQSRELAANLIGVDPYTTPPYPTSSFNGGLTITPITAYNLVVDSNVLSPSSYGPSAATLGAQFCNTSGSAMTNVWAYVGDYNADNDSTPGEAGDLTPGTYPVHNQTTDPAFNATFPHLATPPAQVDYGDPTRFYALEQESGSSSDSGDASRYIGTLAAGECRTEYWLVSYPRKALIGGNWVDVTGGVQPQDDLWLSYFFWATSGATSSNRSYVWNPVTMRNEISAMANKIWPNGDNKVPDQYIQAIQQVLGWDTWTPNGSGTTAYPGETVTSQGIWYDLGNVGAGFDNNGDFVPDRNIWVQPIGDSNAYDPGCFRLVRSYGLVIVKLNDGTELLIPFVDEMYFESIPENNNGAVGLVFYEYVALDGACTAGLTPYQEVASGYDNEKFNADFGAGIPPLQSQQTNMTFDKNGQTSIGLGGTIDYTMTFSLPDVNPTDGMVITVGEPSLGMPLTYYESVPAGLQYVAGSASANVTMTNYSVGTVPATRLWSTDSGATWSETEPAADTLSSAPNNLVMIQWLLDQGIASPAIGPAVMGQVSFSARVPGIYTPTVVNNTSCLKLGSADCFVEDTHTTLVTGTGRIEGTVWRDDATGSGILGNGILDETGAGINAVTVNLYWDANGDGDHTDAGDFLYTTTTSNASGDYAFTNLPATSGSARYLIEVNAADSDIPQGYGPTTATAYTGISLAAGGIYGDAANEPSDFGFAPALDVDKRLDTIGTIMEGDTIQYTIAVSNTLPGSGSSSAMCEYSVWAGAESTSGVPATGSGNSAWQSVLHTLGRPDNRFGWTIMSNNTDMVGLTGFTLGQQAGNITSVKYVVYMKELVDFGDDQFIVRVYHGDVLARTDTYLNATLSSPIGTVYQLEQDITALRSWTWSDFQNNLTEMQVEGNRIGGTSGDAAMDAAGFIITTDQPCGGAGSVLNPVPLTDTFDDNYFDFISANPPVSSSGTGTLTWNNVGPLYPGQTRYITVYMRAALVGTSPATVNTATSTNSKFANGLPANSPESDTASATIVASTNTRSFSGTVFDDNPVAGWTGGAWTVGGAQTGMDAADTGVRYIPVDLYGCVSTTTGNLVTNAGNNQSCAGAGGEWRLMRTTSTGADGSYSFTALARGYYYAAVRYSLVAGSQTADVDQSGACTICDSRSNDPTSNGGAEDLEDATFVGDLDDNTAIARVNFGYNVPTGSYNIGDFFFYDWDGDGVQDASDEPMPGVTVRLLAGDGTPLATITTASDGSYLFSSRPVGYYTVQVDTSTLPAGVVQTKDPDSAMDNQSTFALIANDLTRDFAYQPAGSGTIGDTVWKDINGDGSQSSSEPGIAGVTVVLQVDLNGDGTYANIATAVTDANGKYLFTDLPQGTYRVALERNGNSGVIPNDAFGNDYLPSTGTTSGSFVYRTATLPTSTSSDLTADFGFAPPASIGDTVYYDLNANGTQDFNEAGINGVTVTLYTFTDANANHRYDPGEALSAPVAAATTATVNGKTGSYQFTGLTPGNYVVQVTPPAGMTLTGDPNTDGFACPDLHDPADPGEPSSLVCDSRDGMHLYNGTNYTGADFGYQPLGVIGDTLWIDTDADGVRDLGEQGITDITVRLCSDAACTAVVQTTTTDLDGYYSFGSVPDGTYYVRVSTAGLPAGLTATYNAPHDSFTDDVTRVLVAGGVVTEVGDVTPACTNCSLTVDFGYRYAGALDLSGTLCLENASANGVCGTTGSGVGANESAYANVVVYLYLWNDDGDSLVEANEVTQIASTQTNTSGDYAFANIPGGVYYVVAIGAPQNDIQLTTTQASLGAPTTQVHETADNEGDTISAYQVVQVGAGDVQNRDFAFEAGPLDYGDLPSTYSTLLNDSPAGPSHTVPGSPNLYLGATAPDTETNGSPTADATGDGADEDGVTLVGVWGNGAYNAVNGTGGAVGVRVNGSGTLIGWIDFNRDGDFTDAGEMIVHQTVTTGTANYTFDIPADTFAGPGDPASLTLYARFRLFGSEPMFPALAYAGAAGNGEVEDYEFTWSMTVDKDTTTPNVSPTGTVTYSVVLTNTGDAALSNVQATDALPDFNGAAAGKGYTVTNVAATGGLAVNFPGFDGDTNPNLLAAGNSLAAGASRTITITLTLNGATAATYDNTVAVSSVETGALDDDGTVAQDAGTPLGADPETDEDVTVDSNGSLVIIKDTLPDDAQDFAYTVSGTGLTPFTLDDDVDAALSNTQTFDSLAAGGTYTVTETAVAGWSVTNISCIGATSSTVTVGAAGGFDAGDTAVSVVLAAGETVTCTFENTAILSVVTTKTASDTSIPETGQSVTYIVQVENTSPVEVTLDSLTDDLFNDITTTGHDNVTATTCATGGALAPGATYTCAFAATVSGTFPGTHVNTVTAQVRHGSSTASADDNETITFEEALPELTVVKSSSAGGTVHPGDTITYTITITNTGNVTQNNIIVSDAQPAGTTYVSFSSLASGYIITVPQYYLDRFETAQFNNSNGSTAWGATPWTETGDNGIANSGKIQINTSTAFVADFQATAPTDVLTLTRPVNLTNAASATLTYSIAENGINSAADTAWVQVWNGTAWTTVATYAGDFTSAAGNVNILAYANAGTQIRFVVTGFDGMTQNLTLDNVRVEYTFGSATAKDNDPFGGVSGSLINGSPPTLLFAGDNFDLLPGQSMTVSYRATVNNPVPSGQTQVVNTASVTSTEIVTPVQATVTDNILSADLTVTKTANPTSVPESGGSVTFTYEVQNTGTVPVTLTFLTDDIFGFLTGDADCQAGTVLAPTATCDFTTSQSLSGAAGTTHMNVFTAEAEDADGNPVIDVDDAVVTFTDVLPAISVTKTASPTSVPATGGSVTFTYQVTNTGTVPVTITSLNDDRFGVLTGDADCQVGTVIAPTATCDFTTSQSLSGAAGTTHTNVFTAHAEDSDVNDTSDTDDAVVTFTASGSLTIIKDSVPDDGQDFAFTAAAPLAAFNLDDDADGTLPNTQTFTGLASGNYAVAETPAAGWSLTNIVCSGATGSTISIGTDADFDAGDTNVSVNLAAGENVTCTFSNTRNITLTLRKTWVNALLKDTVNVTAAIGGVTIDTLNSTAETANETDTDLTPVNVMAGEIVTFGETFTTGSAANYTPSVACTGATDADLSDGLTVNAADTAIVCIETNTRGTATLTLQKIWVGAVSGDEGIVTLMGTNNDGFNPIASTPNETDTDPTPTTVYAGETVTLSETFDGLNIGWYTHTLSCSGAADGDLTGGELTIDPADTSITCTFTNTVIPQWPTISKSFSSNPIAAGGTSTLSLVITNPNVGATLTGVAFDDSYPGGLVNTTPVVIANTCGGTLTAVDGGNSVSLSGGSIAPNSNCTITVTVTSAAAGTYTNTTGPVSFSGVVTGNTATATLNVITNAIISDRIWNDVDGDGIQDAGETGLGTGIRVYLDGNNNNVYDAGEVSDVTDASGVYAITGLAAGTYSVRVDATTLPAGYAPTYDLDGGLDHEASVTLLAGQTRTDVDFGYQQLATIGNFVWHDLDMDGIQDGGETGIAGATVHLLDTLGNPVDTTLTNASGVYSFTVRPGSYIVEFVPPAGYLHSPQDQGADDMLDSDASVLTGHTAVVTVTAGEVNNTIDAGMYRLGTIAGQVRYDVDNDGNPLDGDSGIDTVKIELRTDPNGDGNPADGVSVTSTTTNGTGDYSFTNVPPGNYVVVETNPAGYISTHDLDGTTGNTLDQIGISLSSGGNSTGNDFLDTILYSISGQVRYDVNNNGNLADAEGGLDGANVSLWTDPNGDGNPADGTQVGATLTTDVTGNYTFGNLIPGNYVVVEVNPAGYTSTADRIPPNDDRIPVVITSSNSTGNHFLDTLLYSISGQVRYDVDLDGNLADADSGLASANVSLWTDPNGDGDPADGVQLGAPVTTDATGSYSFPNVIPGNYVVVEANPAGYTSTADSAAPNNDRVPVGITNADSTGNDFLDTNMAILGDFVWDDASGNGVQDAGESGLASITVRLLDGSGTVVATTATTASGLYSFTVPAGTYRVDFDLPVGYIFTLVNQGGNDAIDSDADRTTGETANYTLAPGETNNTIDAGMVWPSAIGNFVWNDLDADGVQDPGENGIDGVTVDVYRSGDALPTATQTTAGGGGYFFGLLTPGDYYLHFTLPGGYVFTTQDAAAATDATDSDANIATGNTVVTILLPGEYDSTWDAGIYWPVDLRVTKTDSVATYIPNGSLTYTIRVWNTGPSDAIDASFVDNRPADISSWSWTCAAAGSASCGSTTSGTGNISLNDIDLPADASGTADYLTFTIDATVSAGVSGLLTNSATVTAPSGVRETDATNNSASDTDTLANATLTLQKMVVNDNGGTAADTDWTLTATGPTTISGTEGQSAITGAAVPTGTYTLSESVGPAGYAAVSWSCPAAADHDLSDGLTIGAGENVTCSITNNDQPASIGNYVWNDSDGQGDQDEAAAGLNGVTVNVYRDDGDGVFEPGLGDTLAGTEVTDSAGAYNVASLSAGAYFVDILGPAGYTLTTTNDPLFVLLALGQNYTLADFGFQQTNATISDYLWNDANGDSLQAGESGLGAGIRVYVDLDHDDSYDVGEPTDLTDASGLYAITDLPAGTYDVRVANPPAGYLQTYDLDGTGTSNEASVTVNAGQTRDDVDFGYQLITPELTVAKSSTTTSLSAPGTVTYSYLVTNTGNVALTGISLSDDNDNNDMTCPATTLTPAESMTCTATHTFTQAELDANGSPTAASGVLANLVTANATELTDPVTDALDIPITRNPAINIVKAPATQTVISGNTATFTLNVTNTGNVTLTGVIVTDAQCTGLPVYTGGDANSDGRLQFTETWTYICSTINVITGFTNTAGVTTTQGATDSDTASVTVIVPQADLELTKLVSNAAPYVATDITFTLNIVNRGPDAATGVTVTDVIPTGFTYISDDGGGAYDPATGVWTVGSLANGATRSLTITVRVNVSGSYVNYTQVASSSLTDPDSTPNNASTTEDDDDSVTITPVTGDPSGLGKVVVNSNEASTANPNVAIGEIVTYRLSINIPPGVFTSARLVDTLERGLSYMDCVGITPNGLTTGVVGGFASICANPTVDSAGGTTTVDVGRRVTFDLGTLTNGTASDQTLVIVYRAVVLDSAQNVSGVHLDNGAEFLWGGGSLGPASETLVVAEPDVSIVKTASATSVAVGDEITITLTIQHTAASETNAFDVLVTDDLPADLQYVAGSLECVSGTQPANTCSEAGGIITAGWNNFTLAGGNGRVTFRVTVLSLPVGGVVNTANVAWTSLPGVPPSGPGLPPGQQNANVFSTERGYDPGDLIDVYGASSALSLGAPAGGSAAGQKGGSSRKTLPATGFAPGKVTDLSNIPQETYLSANGVTIEIPSLGITLPVVGVPLKAGTWDVAWLGKQAGWLEGSAFPSWNGNSVLTGHVYLSNGLPGPFVNLSALKYGDKIIVHAYGQKYTFEVRENVVVQPEDTSLLKHETKPWLTLVTCKEYDEKANTYRKRVVVRAVLISVAWE